MKRILIIGATSAIAEACAKEWMTRSSCQFALIGRNTDKLEAIASNLTARGAVSADTFELDINNLDLHKEVLSSALAVLGQIDIALMAQGTLPDQEQCQKNSDYAVAEFTINATSAIAFLTHLANQLEIQKEGRLAVISSVAGDRGRMTNYLYGAAKGALTTFVSGLTARLDKAGVYVSVIKPGFVQTPMTSGLDLPAKLVATPEKVGQVIVRGVEKGKPVIYAPGFWLIIMTIIKLIPSSIFKRLSL